MFGIILLELRNVATVIGLHLVEEDMGTSVEVLAGRMLFPARVQEPTRPLKLAGVFCRILLGLPA